MNRKIFLLGQNNQLVELNEEPYASEDLLQELLANHPALLAGDQMDRANPRRWLLITREMSLPSEQGGSGRWYVDHLLIDQDAVPTVVEVKRSTDTRIRREVIGQILEYAANAVVYWPVESLKAKFEQSCQVRGVTPSDELRSVLGTGVDAEAFWHQVKTNLQAGRIRLVFVADEIPSELRRVVEFLNQQMDPAEVLAVEVKQFIGVNVKTLVPSVIGQTEEAKIRKGTSGAASAPQWDEESFFARLKETSPASELAVARKLFGWATERMTRIDWGRGARDGSFTPVLLHKGREFKVFVAYTYGSVEIHFQTLQNKPPFNSEERRLEIVNRLNEIDGVAIKPESITQRPAIRLGVLAQDERKLESLLSVFGWIVEQIQASS